MQGREPWVCVSTALVPFHCRLILLSLLISLGSWWMSLPWYLCRKVSLWRGIHFCAYDSGSASFSKVSRLVLEHQVWVRDQHWAFVSCLGSFGLAKFPLPQGSCSPVSCLAWCCNGFLATETHPGFQLFAFSKKRVIWPKLPLGAIEKKFSYDNKFSWSF